MTGVVIDVLGTPAPKGSARAILIKGRAVMVPSGSNVNRDALKAWDKAVKAGALAAVGVRADAVYVDVALHVVIVFRLARPKTIDREQPTVKPDVDKLARATLDSLIGLVIDDDARVIALTTAKEYASAGNEGARIIVDRWQP